MGRLKSYVFACLLVFASFGLRAQVNFDPVFTTLRLEARADFDYYCASDADDQFGFTGRYFNLHIGGNLSDKFTYYFRQRIVANPGTSTLFDNTDFLYLNYNMNDNWTFRLGKDALAVGGFEYDAPPIDVLFCSNYWNYFYCFQLAASVAYHSNDGKQTFILQTANSPYIHFQSEMKNSLMSYNMFWSGTFGHFKTLYSVNMFQRKSDKYMNYVALGHKIIYSKWDWYVDLIHRANSTSQLLRNYSVISCANVYFNSNFSMFVKGGYEQNRDSDEYAYFTLTGDTWDCLSEPALRHVFYGLGFEYRPAICHDVRIHGFVANYNSSSAVQTASKTLNVNVGITWDMNILRDLRSKRIIGK